MHTPQLSATTGEVPQTLERALDPQWLTVALSCLTRGARVTTVQTVEVIRTMATKARFVANFDGAASGGEALCLKAFLDVDAENARGGIVSIKEADFYAELAPKVSVRVPTCVAAIVDRDAKLGIIIMRDLIHAGARFCTALESLTRDQAAQSLEQLARLHTNQATLQKTPWVTRRIADLARGTYVPLPTLQEMLNGPRGEGLPARTRDAAVLLDAMKALAMRDEAHAQTLVHGDCHAGNLYQTSAGPGLIDWQLLQRGSWALDVAYHISAVLAVEVAETDERALLNHYLDTVRSLGGVAPNREAAWAQYRSSVVYGYFLWSITRRVDPAIINVFVNRLGSAVTRHESFELLGV
jgi:aminoglycoside phosphotransferase (APT) family kinase protein